MRATRTCRGVHLTGRQAAEHAAQAGAGALVLTHLVPWNDQERTLAEAAAAFPGPVSLATGRVRWTSERLPVRDPQQRLSR